MMISLECRREAETMSIGIRDALILKTHKHGNDCGMNHHLSDDVTITTNTPYNLIHNNPLVWQHATYNPMIGL